MGGFISALEIRDPAVLGKEDLNLFQAQDRTIPE
jgi:hypothetical protein